jgi:hypothetical protein
MGVWYLIIQIFSLNCTKNSDNDNELVSFTTIIKYYIVSILICFKFMFIHNYT